MKTIALVASLFLASCTCSKKQDWDVPYHVGKGRMVASNLEWCIKSHDCSQISRDNCMAAARGECLDAGLPKTCGYGEPEFTTPCGQ